MSRRPGVPPASPWRDPPRRRARAGVLAAVLLAGLAACAGFGGRSDELRGRLIGVDARTLRNCVGVPSSIDIEGDQEVHVYRFSDEISSLDRFPGPFQTPIERDRDRERTGRDSAGVCELTFALRGGRVENVVVKGRRSSGLNDDAGCLRRAEACATAAPSDSRSQK